MDIKKAENRAGRKIESSYNFYEGPQVGKYMEGCWCFICWFDCEDGQCSIIGNACQEILKDG